MWEWCKNIYIYVCVSLPPLQLPPLWLIFQHHCRGWGYVTSTTGQWARLGNWALKLCMCVYPCTFMQLAMHFHKKDVRCRDQKCAFICPFHMGDYFSTLRLYTSGFVYSCCECAMRRRHVVKRVGRVNDDRQQHLPSTPSRWQHLCLRAEANKHRQRPQIKW